MAQLSTLPFPISDCYKIIPIIDEYIYSHRKDSIVLFLPVAYLSKNRILDCEDNQIFQLSRAKHKETAPTMHHMKEIEDYLFFLDI